MSHEIHERVVYACCGAVHHQCRCMEGGRNVKTIPGPCPACARKTNSVPAAEPAPRLAHVKVEAWDDAGELMYRYDAVEAPSHVIEIRVTETLGLHKIEIVTADRPVKKDG